MKLDAKEASFNLAVTRFFYFSFVFYLLGTNRYFLEWQNVPSEFWHPTGLMKFFSSPPISTEAHTWIFHFWRWSLPLCAVGFGYRLLAPLNFVCGFSLMNFAHSFGYQTHVYMPVLLVGLVLSFSAASDVLSLDAMLLRRWIRRTNEARLYHLPLRTAQLIFCLVFFAAGVSKLRTSGIDWFTTDTLRNYFLISSIKFVDVNAFAHEFRLNHSLYSMPLLCNVLAFLTVALEISIPLAFFVRRAAWLLIPSILIAQIGIFFTVFVNFTIYLAIYVAWINWSWVANRVTHFSLAALRRRASA